MTALIWLSLALASAQAAPIAVDTFQCQGSFTDVFGDTQTQAGSVCVPRTPVAISPDCLGFDQCQAGSLSWTANFTGGATPQSLTVYYNYKTAERLQSSPGAPAGQRFQTCSGTLAEAGDIALCAGNSSWQKTTKDAAGWIVMPVSAFPVQSASTDHVGDFTVGCQLQKTALVDEASACR